jgi:solute carrier family 25 citrate transporter 1
VRRPLDTSKTRLQIDKTGRYRGLVNTLTTIAREEGAGALYKGLTPFVTHLTLKYALRFGSFGYYKSAMGTYASSLSDSSRNFLAGLAAGITEAILIVTPFERVKTVLQKQHGLDKSKLKYQGPVHAAVTIAREEGVRALWNGAAPTIARQATNQAALFWSYPQILKLFSDRVEGDGKQQAPWKPATAALLGAMIGPLSKYVQSARPGGARERRERCVRY